MGKDQLENLLQLAETRTRNSSTKEEFYLAMEEVLKDSAFLQILQEFSTQEKIEVSADYRDL